MHDYFNMAYQDNANALQLHIKSKELSKYLLSKKSPIQHLIDILLLQ